MPITYLINNERKIIFARGSGVIAYEDLRSHLASRSSSPARQYALLFDLTGTKTSISPDEMRAIVNQRFQIASHVPPSPVAFAASDDNVYALLRMMEMMTERLRPIGVFRTVEDAEGWLHGLTGRT